MEILLSGVIYYPLPPSAHFHFSLNLFLLHIQKGIHGKPSQSHPTFKQTLKDGKDIFRHIVQSPSLRTKYLKLAWISPVVVFTFGLQRACIQSVKFWTPSKSWLVTQNQLLSCLFSPSLPYPPPRLHLLCPLPNFSIINSYIYLFIVINKCFWEETETDNINQINLFAVQ